MKTLVSNTTIHVLNYLTGCRMHFFQYFTMCLQLSTLKKKKNAFVRLAQAVNDMPQKLIKDKIHFFSKPCRC